MDEPLELLELAKEAAVAASELLADRQPYVRAFVGTKSSPTDMVTEVDTASEQLIVRLLLASRPDDGIYAEEGSARQGTSGVRWVIDPLDGTTNYLYGFPAYAVSIAAEADGETIAGVVLNAASGELFAAARGHGATLDSSPLHVSEEADLARALVATGFGYSHVWRVRQAEVLTGLIGDVRDIRRAGSAALDLCHVACGRVDAYYELGLHPWDYAAGALIAEEAGGKAARVEHPRFAEPWIVAANSLLFERFREMVVRAAG